MDDAEIIGHWPVLRILLGKNFADCGPISSFPSVLAVLIYVNSSTGQANLFRSASKDFRKKAEYYGGE
jgi:hypothetical protein